MEDDPEFLQDYQQTSYNNFRFSQHDQYPTQSLQQHHHHQPRDQPPATNNSFVSYSRDNAFKENFQRLSQAQSEFGQQL